MNIVYEALLCICSDELFYRLWYIYLLEQKLFSNAEIEFINKLSFVFMKIYIKKKYDFKWKDKGKF